MLISDQDARFLQMALELARLGVGLTSPNPCVGAVIVDAAGKVVGEGSHTHAGVKHAEIIALGAAGNYADGATLYINLEPCNHTGRTGPCADAVVSAKIKRVVCAMQDPNPKVSGKGLQKLRDAGIAVVLAEGELAERARTLNESFACYIQSKRPLVTLKAGMTLDGKIAPPPGDSENPTGLGMSAARGGWITSEEARAHVHLLRHASDAILVGVGTVIADDPLLTDRSALPRRRPLLRIILDSRLRLPVESRLVQSAKDDVIVFCSFAESNRKKDLEARGIRVEQLPLYPSTERHVVGGRPVQTGDGRPDLVSLMQRLGSMEITSLMIEGGALVNWAALAADVVDKVFLYYAPKILAGSGSVPFASGEGFRHVHEAAQVRHIRLHRFGEDFAVEGYLREIYQIAKPKGPEAFTGEIYEGV